MNNNILNTKKTTEEPIVIPDECGDSLWDAVLEQDVKTSEPKIVTQLGPLNKMVVVQVCDASKVE